MVSVHVTDADHCAETVMRNVPALHRLMEQPIDLGHPSLTELAAIVRVGYFFLGMCDALYRAYKTAKRITAEERKTEQ